MTDDSLPVKSAQGEFPERVPRTTINRWMDEGVLNRHTQQRVYLEYENLGGQRRIRRSAISTFIAALQPPKRE